MEELNEYNPKIDYLFSKYLHFNSTAVEDEQEYKLVYKRICPPSNQEQIFMVRCKNILAFIKKKTTRFTLNSILKCYKLLSENDLSLTKEKKQILEQLIKDFKIDLSYEFAGAWLIKLLNEEIFPKEINIEMSKIIHNFIQLKRGYTPAVLYNFYIKRIKKLIANDDFEGATNEMRNIYFQTSKINETHAIIPLELIKDKLLEIRSELLVRFAVKNLYIYGSYSRGEQNEYSDLDIYIQLNNSEESKNDIKYQIFAYLEKQLGISIDGTIEYPPYPQANLKMDMKRNLIKIF